MAEERIFLTPKQVALALGCETQYLKEHESQLGLRSTKTPGGHRRYSLSDVERVMSRLTIASETDLELAKLLIVRAKDLSR